MRTLTMLLLVAAAATAGIETKMIEYKDGETVLEGYLAYNASLSSLRPGVLVVHQWMGLTDHEKTQAKKLAELGYVALAVDIYGKGVRPKSPQEARAETSKYRGKDRTLYRQRLLAGLRALRELKFVARDKIAAIGFCFGGTGVLELARSGADVLGVVSFHGGLGTATPKDANNIKGKVLVLHGADDPHVPPEEVAAFMKEMRDANVDWQLVAYGGAVHSFTQPSADRETAKYHPDAARRSWLAMRNFFDEIFK
jgi:dienelactone hydrolase